MSEVNRFITFGIGIIVTGIIWLVYDAALVDIKAEYWISTPYLEFMNMGFNVYPTAVLILGILSLLAGIKIRAGVST